MRAARDEAAVGRIPFAWCAGWGGARPGTVAPGCAGPGGVMPAANGLSVINLGMNYLSCQLPPTRGFHGPCRSGKAGLYALPPVCDMRKKAHGDWVCAGCIQRCCGTASAQRAGRRRCVSFG
ncbi:hypothetical protein D7S79_11270 [Ralstonia insidiosa]|nr:hypothetical protein [Ralstonia insidiosa]